MTRHQFLAHPGVPEDQYRQVRGGDGFRLAAQLHHGSAGPHQFVHQTVGLLAQLDLLTTLQLFLEVMDPIRRPHRGRRHGHEGLKGVQVEVVKGVGAHGVEGDGTPGLIPHIEWRAEAVVNVQVVVTTLHQPVVGVRQGRVGGEAHRAVAVENLGETGVITDHKAPPQGIRRQALYHPGDQLAAVPFQEGDGVAGEVSPKQVQQALEALLTGHRTGQVGDQGGEVIEGAGCCH